MGGLTGLLPGWHWTYTLVILYGVIAVGLFLVRSRLIRRQTGWRNTPAVDDEFRCGIKARFGIAGSIFLGLALICMFIGADQDNQLTGKILDDASFFLLTAGFIEMAIYPWSPAALEIGSDLRPSLYDANRKRITGEWDGQPAIQVVTLDHIRVQGKRVSRKEGSHPEMQHLDIYRFHLGDRAFGQLLVFLERKAHVHLPVRE